MNIQISPTSHWHGDSPSQIKNNMRPKTFIVTGDPKIPDELGMLSEAPEARKLVEFKTYNNLAVLSVHRVAQQIYQILV